MATQSTDMPTVARLRSRLNSLQSEDITIAQAMWVFGVSTEAPIMLRIERGEFSAAKVMGQWSIDVQSLHAYLTKLNHEFNRSH